ncbi:putative ubiquitin-conjugating enzyme e2 [Leishmania infantum JPCM5]|uniref:Ubiquitin-conjugating_enzyme_E2_-_putative n=2 Tax=Leishmania infantum TaxID=5671 RepID=A0A6L0XQG3_LEIIN|nr:putative ubiquitin-conjugating enzyme e2 [Leishmania infantum JPCM5]CAC9492222.1 ubiquitin-conjugating_enzyme_E2_-_putative [Leishmania infantum]CBZ08747.1 putative ubiquitin-conjugating enzyme e2 [Leishmania infantum JPCM5]SUZ42257.1 ubiquitin-conjugating_enzyme_E2_-_putative [Leishmania infantum]|eukprot:XP_003392579.1 putative ubiquitin-conjugating enzyme e2 [Leishmania infantum JPCM5]
MSLARLTRERKQLLEAQQCGETAPSTSANTTAASVNSFSAAQGRIRADMQKLDGVMSEVKMDSMDWYVVHVAYTPVRGIWKGGTFNFRLVFSNDFPYCGPKVRYTGPRRIFHPNIEGDDGKEDWGVCLGIQTEWRPTCTIKDMVVAIEMLFALPNYDDPLPGVAKTAAQILKDEPSRFELIAKRWMGGNYII